jgi:hypothetical protein
MGTSTSSRGPRRDSPLVPPWADTDGKGPGPKPDPNRFQGFRTSLGKFVSSGDTDYLNKALQRYSSTATGGAETGARRFGAMTSVGGELIQIIEGLRRDAVKIPLSLRQLVGKSTQIAIEAIVEALVPENGDADRIRAALNDALSECLEGLEEFDPSQIVDEMLVSLLLTYVENCIFEQIVMDSRDAFAKASDPAKAEQAERELRALVKAATEIHLRPLLAAGTALTKSQMARIQSQAIRDIWETWSGWSS